MVSQVSDIERIGTVEVTATDYGPAAYEVLASVIREAKSGDPLAPMTVVVPSHYTGLAAARAMALAPVDAGTPPPHDRPRGIAAVAFITVHDLAERLGGRRMAVAGRHPVSNAVIAGAVRSVLREDPGHFAGVATHPATERALVDAYRDLSEASSAGLRALTMQSERAADVVRIHREVNHILLPGFGNEHQLADEAVAALASDPETAGRLGRVVVFLPQRLTRSQTRLLRAIASTAATTVVAGLTGHPDADSAVKASLKRMGVTLDGPPPAYDESPPTRIAGSPWDHPDSAAQRPGTAGTSQHALPEAHRAHQRPGTAGTSAGVSALRRILRGREVTASSVSDADDEVRHAVRAVVAAARAGTRLGRCAIVYGTPQPYARLVCDALDAAGVDRRGATVHTAATSWLGRSLLGLLSLRGNGFTSRSVTAWLHTAHTKIERSPTKRAPDHDDHPPRQHTDHDRAGTTPRSGRVLAPVAAWERVARAARVDSHRIEDWDHRLRQYALTCGGRAARFEGVEGQAWLSRRCRRRAGQAEEFLGFVRRLHGHLHPEPQPRTWRALTKWCRGLIRVYLGGHHRNNWPDDERRLAESVDAAVDLLGDLDDIDSGPSPERFHRALESALADSTLPVGRFGDGVLVGPPNLALGVELDLAVVCGLAEGVFPARGRIGSLLSDRERRLADDSMPLASDRTGDDLRDFLAVLTAARSVLLLYPRGDLRRTADNSPSRWLLDVAEAEDPKGIRPTGTDPTHTTDGWLKEIPSFTAGLRAAAFPSSAQEYDMRALLDRYETHGRHEHPHDGITDHRTALRRGIETRLARQSAALTRFDGNLFSDGDLRGVELPSPVGPGAVTSASRLEAWAKCPHAYFVRHVLGVDTVDDHSDGYRISPIDLGGLVHDILERWLSEAMASGETPRPHEPWPGTWRRRLVEIGEEQCGQMEASGLGGRGLYWRSDRRRVLNDLSRFVDFDDEMRSRHRCTPLAVELGFGLPGSGHAPVEVRLPGESDYGSVVRIRGSIDRIDATESGDLVVVDYKTGSDYRYRRLQAEEPTRHDGHLQLVLYALAARSITAADSAVPAYGGDTTSRTIGRSSKTAVLADGGDTPGAASGDYGAYWFVTSRGGFKSEGYRVDSASRPGTRNRRRDRGRYEERTVPRTPSRTQITSGRRMPLLRPRRPGHP